MASRVLETGSEEEDVEPVRRSKGRKYELPSHTFENETVADKILDREFMGAYWDYKGNKNDVNWYQCRCGCKLRLKLQ